MDKIKFTDLFRQRNYGWPSTLQP